MGSGLPALKRRTYSITVFFCGHVPASTGLFYTATDNAGTDAHRNESQTKTATNVTSKRSNVVEFPFRKVSVTRSVARLAA